MGVQDAKRTPRPCPSWVNCSQSCDDVNVCSPPNRLHCARDALGPAADIGRNTPSAGLEGRSIPIADVDFGAGDVADGPSNSSALEGKTKISRKRL